MAELASLMYEKGDLRKTGHKLVGVLLFSVAISFGSLAVLRAFGRLVGIIIDGVGFSAKVQALGLGDLLGFTAEPLFVAGLIVAVVALKFLKDMTRLGDFFLTGKHTPMDLDVRSSDAMTGIAFASYDGLFAMANYVFSKSSVKDRRTLMNLGLASIATITAYMITVML